MILITKLSSEMNITQIQTNTISQRKSRERGIYLETLMEASGALRSSNVTTSNPTLSPPCLISPIIYKKNWQRILSHYYGGKEGPEIKKEATLTSVKSLNL